MSYSRPGSPFALATTNSSANAAQMNIFSAPWIASDRSIPGRALVEGVIVPQLAMVGTTKFSNPTIPDQRNWWGSPWGADGTAKAVCEDRMCVVASSISWAWDVQTGTTTIFTDRTRVVVTRLPS